MDVTEPKWVDIEVVGENTKKLYKGAFKIKPFLAHKESSDAARLAEMYRRGITEDFDQRSFLTLLAYLKFYVVETDAKWWSSENGLDMLDREPIAKLGDKLAEVQGVKKDEKEEVK